MNPILALRDVVFVRDGRTILDDISWSVDSDQRWVVLGRNGCGKTTMVQLASLYLHPTSGTVEVLGQALGRMDVRAMRRRIGLASAALSNQLRPQLRAADVVVTAKNAALEPWWHQYDDADYERVYHLLDRFGCLSHAQQEFATLSSGERQRVLLARTLMCEPALVLLDEPTAGLDLGGREELVKSLTHLAADPTSAPVVLVTHHLEEIPPGFTHALLLRDGRVLAAGPMDEVISSEAISECFAVAVQVERYGARFAARAV
ncbi:MAG: putative transporter ATP-binding protein [Acidimicrobiia bacterium]|nr:putative transporter ATP-binding protein [Acidimicrobiia bacterium]